MSGLLIENLQAVKGIDPVADAHAGGVASDIIDMSAFNRIVFLVYRGVATGGTAAPTYTVDACSDTSATATSTVPFYHRKDGAAVAVALAAGVQAAAGSSKIDMIEVHDSALAPSGYRYVRLAIAETVNDPVVSGVLAFGELKDASSNAQANVVD